MAEDLEKIAESAWREAFRLRLREIQGKRTQEDMAELLGISRDTWNKCVNRGDMFPIRKLPRLAKLAEMSLEELIRVDTAGVKETSQVTRRGRTPRRRLA
jgi:DNA-binding XRE family transcriptional regulator